MWAVVEKRSGAILDEFLEERQAAHLIDDSEEPYELEIIHFAEEEETNEGT